MPRVRLFHLRHIFGRAFGEELTAFCAAFGTEVNDPVGGFHQIEVMLDDDNAIACVHQSLQDFEQADGVGEMQTLYEEVAPLARNVTHDEVGRTGAWLLSNLSDGITAEVLHIDGGYNAMGSPGRMVDRWKASQKS